MLEINIVLCCASCFENSDDNFRKKCGKSILLRIFCVVFHLCFLAYRKINRNLDFCFSVGNKVLVSILRFLSKFRICGENFQGLHGRKWYMRRCQCGRTPLCTAVNCAVAPSLWVCFAIPRSSWQFTGGEWWWVLVVPSPLLNAVKCCTISIERKKGSSSIFLPLPSIPKQRP